jgi:gamma-glutamylcyclotransferase (GGCT)/AIG2-like uncharacterized protein YtfP
MTNLFVYGTLIDDAAIRSVLGRVPRSRVAVLRGFRRVAHEKGPWVVAEPDPAAQIQGKVLEGLSEGEVDRFDKFEGVDLGLYRRIPVHVEVGAVRVEAWTYVRV